MVKDTDGDTDEASENANLFLCTNGSCANNGEGHLDVNEVVLNAGGDPDGVGAFEFELKYDHKIFDISIDHTNWLYSTSRVPDDGSTLGAEVGGCNATILTENYIFFGCVSKNPKDGSGNPIITTGVQTDGAAAIIHVTPDPDLVNRITPGNNNGVVRTLLDENCELANIWGHPLTDGTFDALGRPSSCPVSPTVVSCRTALISRSPYASSRAT